MSGKKRSDFLCLYGVELFLFRTFGFKMASFVGSYLKEIIQLTKPGINISLLEENRHYAFKV